MNFRCHKVYLTQHSYPRYVEDATLAQRPRTSCSSSMDVSRGLPMPLGLATARPRGDVRHIFIFTTYLATSNISHFERHISDRATYLGSSDISCAERHISLRATYLRERRHMMKFDICRSERHKSRATYDDVLRHMSLVRDRRRKSMPPTPPRSAPPCAIYMYPKPTTPTWPPCNFAMHIQSDSLSPYNA